MKIKLAECYQVFNVLVDLHGANGGKLSPVLMANMSYLRPEVQRANELSEAERQSFADVDLDIPLKPITQDDLPEVMPPDFYELLNPIAQSAFKNQKTAVEKLIEEQKDQKDNGEKEKVS